MAEGREVRTRTGGKGPARRDPTLGPAPGRATRSGPVKDRAGRVAPGGTVAPITAPRADGRREPTGRIAPERRSSRQAARGTPLPAMVGIGASLLFLAGLALGVVGGRVALWVALVYALMSVVALLWYGLDKSAAVNNRRRTPERTLHLLALLGGWPGALLGQSLFRHKSSKTSFQWAFRATVLVNVALLAWLIWSRAGMGADRTLIEGWRLLGTLAGKAVDAMRH